MYLAVQRLPCAWRTSKSSPRLNVLPCLTQTDGMASELDRVSFDAFQHTRSKMIELRSMSGVGGRDGDGW